jgi:CDP-glycerol glycerophosphotransferase (TagB/SpsB family)
MLNVNKQAVWNRAFPGISVPRHVFLWLPTFRSAPLLGSRTDGKNFNNVFNCRDFSETVFNSLLKANDAVCIVKPHPMAARLDHSDYSNLFFIDESWLNHRQLSLYQLVGAADVLISDISSVIVDFMLLDRPIVLLFEDSDSYKNSRGFTFNPIADFLPAEITRDFVGFIGEIEAILAGKDPYSARRSELRRMFFDYVDAGASDRILDKVMGKAE